MYLDFFDNIGKLLKDDLSQTILPHSRISVAAACFSVYAFQELKEQLESIEELRFLFTSPTFTTEKAQKSQREFYIPRLDRERSIYGTEFEIKLRNELTQKAIAQECVAWIKKKVRFKSNATPESMSGFLAIEQKENTFVYAPMQGFTTVELGTKRGNNSYTAINKLGSPVSINYLNIFNAIWSDEKKVQDITEEVLENITAGYSENPPEKLYFFTLFHIFSDFLEDISEDILPNEATGFKESKIWSCLYNFQQDAALAIINKLEKYNGCILADSVGLGKTYTALAVIKYYENRNKSVLLLCPKKLTDNWKTYKANYINNPIAQDRLRFDVLYHTDLSRAGGVSNGLDLARLNWGNYDLVVIDESHNFRNGGQFSGEDNEKENRYLRLLNKVIRAGVKTKILMLSATPVNNRFNDLKNQLALAYEGNSSLINAQLNTSRPIDEIFRNAQRAFNTWEKKKGQERTTADLMQMLDSDFFELLDSVTIARSRKHITKYYNMSEIGSFPRRNTPVSLTPSLTDLPDTFGFNDIYEQLTMLNLSVYAPSKYIFESRRKKYDDLYDSNMGNAVFTQANREQGIQRLMNINLLKRLESSVHSFRLTLQRIRAGIQQCIVSIDSFTGGRGFIDAEIVPQEQELDFDDQNTDLFTVGKKVRIALQDMDYKTWYADLASDAAVLDRLLQNLVCIIPKHDTKLQTLLRVVDEKIQRPLNNENKKILLFTAFSDTAEYVYEHISKYIQAQYGLHSALITGSVEGKTTIAKFKPTLNNVLTCFSPVSKEKILIMPDQKESIDILIATDCISEGQNLQDCDFVVNYDIHWNPVRIIQRFGRVDRIGSKNSFIQMVNFWPALSLDTYINLKSRVESRMRISVMTSTGDDDLINKDEQGDLAYRKQQLQRLKSEVVDIEDISGGVSITDLGLNEFRLDLVEYMKSEPNFERMPFGLHTLVPKQEGLPQGIIFVLKNIHNKGDIENQNRIYPYYMVYLQEDGTVFLDYLAPKELLDTIRYLCKGHSEVHTDLCKAFNKATRNGLIMDKYSALLGNAISSIVQVKKESDIDSLFRAGGTTALVSPIKGLDDFELICFFVIQ